MEQRRGRSRVWSRLLLLLVGFISVDCIVMRMDKEVNGVVGESVTLWCGFTSEIPISDVVMVDWKYRSLEGGPTFTILHYQGKPYPILQGTFKDRITWEGNIARGDASILLKDLKLTDNGTFSCWVKNPPDFYGDLPETKLTVTLKSVSFKFTTVILLSALVIIPSFLVAIILLIRMKRAIKRDRARNQNLKKSSIEESQDCVYDENATSSLHCNSPSEKPPGCLMRLCLRCADDYDDDDYVGETRNLM